MSTRVHLCCGPQIWPGWVNVDVVDFGQEVKADLAQSWRFSAPGSVDYILCKDGFEHMESTEHFLREAARILRPGGRLELWVPHFRNPSAYRLTHRSYYSWSLFNVFPEPHDVVQNLRVISNRLYIGHKSSRALAPLHWLANLNPKWWERLLYVSNVEVILEKVPGARFPHAVDG
jgi:predicted SAM-dependent methyltransferase